MKKVIITIAYILLTAPSIAATKQSFPSDNVTFVGHFGCVNRADIDREILLAVTESCAQYGKTPEILPDTAIVYRCDDDNEIHLTLSYKCVDITKE